MSGHLYMNSKTVFLRFEPVCIIFFNYKSVKNKRNITKGHLAVLKRNLEIRTKFYTKLITKFIKVVMQKWYSSFSVCHTGNTERVLKPTDYYYFCLADIRDCNNEIKKAILHLNLSLAIRYVPHNPQISAPTTLPESWDLLIDNDFAVSP